MRSKKKLLLTLVSLCLISNSSLYAVDHEEGGYVGHSGQGHDTVVYNFLKHFNYEQYYWGYKSEWTTQNNTYVDAMDFAIFAGHGNRWLIALLDGNVDLASAGSSSNEGYGDTDLEFVAFESCSVIPSPLEVSDWWTNWVGSNGIFDGLHQALGFRTSSYQSTDEKITDYFGEKIHSGNKVWQSWFEAINAKGLSYEKGSAVMHPSTQDDTYASFVADPPANHTNLTIWYQQ